MNSAIVHRDTNGNAVSRRMHSQNDKPRRRLERNTPGRMAATDDGSKNFRPVLPAGPVF
jgi:hypothetical protein